MLLHNGRYIFQISMSVQIALHTILCRPCIPCISLIYYYYLDIAIGIGDGITLLFINYVFLCICFYVYMFTLSLSMKYIVIDLYSSCFCAIDALTMQYSSRCCCWCCNVWPLCQCRASEIKIPLHKEIVLDSSHPAHSVRRDSVEANILKRRH